MELEQLHSHAPQHSLNFTQTAIRQAFAGGIDDLFQQFEEQPVASGSIAQVYRAQLSQKGALHTGIDAGMHPSPHINHASLRAPLESCALLSTIIDLTSGP